ncbi:MAG: 4Fe-4S binding protein [Armatimonadetes bacterium]|nr:4Fe-4S binding protein [Armatimonadota bacterium]
MEEYEILDKGIKAKVVKKALNKLIKEGKEKIIFAKSWCKGCEICTQMCPKGALKLDSHGKVYLAHPEFCNLCGICELNCPDFGIIIPKKTKK